MYITCKCLNVSVKTRSDELKEFDRDTVNDITNSDCYSDFFQLPLAVAIELDEINKEQSGLVINRNIGLWCIHRCINCSMYTHAVHRNYGAGLVIINKNMIISNDEIEKLKLHKKYSNIFKIIIDYDDLNNDEVQQNQLPSPLAKYSMSQLSNNIQLALTNLQQQLEQSMQKEAAIVDEKICKFTTEQYQLLEQYREQAYIEYNLLSHIICDNNNYYNHEEPLNTMIINNIKKQNNIDVRLINKNFIHDSSVDTTDLNPSHDCEKKKYFVDTTVREKKEDNSMKIMTTYENIDNKLKKKKTNYNFEKYDRYDCGEAMFALEGMDDTINSIDQEVTLEIEESDAEDEDSGQDEGIHIPRGQRGGHPTLAKSLPVSVPNFSTFQRQTMQKSDDDQQSVDPLDPHNIRASIKALAKSVHGDAVFGDLPRPRFSTQI